MDLEEPGVLIFINNVYRVSDAERR